MRGYQRIGERLISLDLARSPPESIRKIRAACAEGRYIANLPRKKKLMYRLDGELRSRGPHN